MRLATITIEVPVVDNATMHEIRSIGEALIRGQADMRIQSVDWGTPGGHGGTLDFDFLRSILRIMGGIAKHGPTGEPIVAMLSCGHPQEITKWVWESWCIAKKPKHRFIQCGSCQALYKKEHPTLSPSAFAAACAKTPEDDGESIPFVVSKSRPKKKEAK